jgi:hypothetical protein
MDRELARLIDADTPKLNPVLANGLAIEHMKQVETYVDQVFRSAAKGFPPGLVYVKPERCTPQEEYDEISKIKNAKREFDVARSDIYMMKYHFTYQGQPLPPRYLSLPFVGDAGTITLGGSRFVISPVLSDRVISIGVNNIFVRLLKARLTFERQDQHFMVDGQRETVQVAWSTIYNKNAKMKKIKATMKADCTLMHYLLCKYGFVDTFLRYGDGAQPIVGGAEITHHVYPENEWVICGSICTGSTLKPKGVPKGPYEPTQIRVAVKRSEFTPMVKNMLGGFFYVVDHFPDRLPPEVITSQAFPTQRWKVLLGHIIFPAENKEGKLLADIDIHMQSLDEYIDNLVLVKLKEIGIEIESVYDLFAIVVRNFTDWLLDATDKIASMYDKEFSILYYVLYEISSAIFKLYFKLKAANKKELTPKEIIATMNMTLRTGLIYSITKGHGEVSTISVPGDNKAFKITSILVPQSSSNRQSSRKDRAVLNDPSKRLHVSVAEVGCYSALPKSEPSGRSRVNQCVQLDDKWVAVRNPVRAPLLDQIQSRIKR